MFDFTGKKSALDAVADIIEPAAIIMADKEISAMQKTPGTPIVKMIKPAIKNHKKEVIEILARLETEEGMPVEEYVKTIGLMTVPTAFLAMIQSPEFAKVFGLQGQSAQKTSSGSATENTEVSEN